MKAKTNQYEFGDFQYFMINVLANALLIGAMLQVYENIKYKNK